MICAADGPSIATFGIAPDAVSTVGLGINDQNDVAGYYLTKANQNRGFTVIGGATTIYNFGDGTSTIVSGINNAGNFAGRYLDNRRSGFSSFISVGGVLSDFVVPGSAETALFGISNNNDFVGRASGTGLVVRGATIELFSYPTADTLYTAIYGISDTGWIAGDAFAPSLGCIVWQSRLKCLPSP